MHIVAEKEANKLRDETPSLVLLTSEPPVLFIGFIQSQPVNKVRPS